MKSVLVSEVSTLWNEIKRRMVLTSFSSGTISIYHQVFRCLIEYLNSQGIKQYSEDVGKEFLANVEKNRGLSKSTLTRYIKTIARLDSCMNGDFWYEGYGLDNYIIKNDSIQKLYDKICLDLDILKSKTTARNRVKLCIFRLDIFMYENAQNYYTPLVGEKFLEFMRLHSTYMDHSFQYTYVLTIDRLDSYWRNEKPKMRIPSDYEISNPDLQKGLDDLIIILKDKQFKEKSISNAIHIIKQLDFYMRNQEISCYSSDVGKQFLIDIKQYWKTRDEDGYAVPVIAHLDDVIAGNNFVRYHLKKDYSVISQFSDSFNLFIHECEEKGNRNSTLNEKKLYCNSFFNVLINIGLDNIGIINADHVVEACSSLPPKAWATVKAYLSSCFNNGLVDKDYTYLVPRKRTKVLIPPYYTKEERLKLEKAPDRNTPIGKRDYAIILIANRLGMRSSDIVNLAFSSLDLGKKTIDYNQYKTENYQELPLLEEIEAALDDYILNGRPKSTSDKIFLMSFAPYDPLHSLAIHGIITKNFRLAGVDISNRKHGPHALRASLGTDMVNNGRSFEQVRYMYGQKDKDVIQHYVRLDVEKLRQCALKPLPPTGDFKKLLEGGIDG